MTTYGLPYKGSKSKIADKIVALFPKRTNLYDLFMGGGAITHYAMTTHKFQRFFCNDINPHCPQLFQGALNGDYNNENRWISREEFDMLKDTDPYVSFVWSFGNNLRDYLYGKEIEPFKKALHYVLYFQDPSLMKEFGYDMSRICELGSIDRRYDAIRDFFKITPPNSIIISNITSTIGGYGMFKSWYAAAVCHQYARQERLLQLQGATRNLPTNQESTNTLWGGGKNLTILNMDYADIEVLPDSVIYCDIPYKSTNVYDEDNPFDYDRFYAWCENQTQPLFISEYWMPEDRFECVAEFQHTSTMDANSVKSVVERVFIPRTQKNLTPKQLTLDFD